MKYLSTLLILVLVGCAQSGDAPSAAAHQASKDAWDNLYRAYPVATNTGTNTFTTPSGFSGTCEGPTSNLMPDMSDLIAWTCKNASRGQHTCDVVYVVPDTTYHSNCN